MTQNGAIQTCPYILVPVDYGLTDERIVIPAIKAVTLALQFLESKLYA